MRSEVGNLRAARKKSVSAQSNAKRLCVTPVPAAAGGFAMDVIAMEGLIQNEPRGTQSQDML